MNDDKVDDMGGVGEVMFGFEVICGDSVLAVLKMIFLSLIYILCK